MLQVQVPAAAMIVVRQRTGKAYTVKFASHVTVEPIQNSGRAKRFHSDYWKASEFVRRGEHADITLFKQRPIVNSFWSILEITNQGNICFAL